MKIHITFAGGGTGGHLYPLLSVADELQTRQDVDIRISYFGPENALMDEFVTRNIKTYKIASSKLRRYFDIQNIIDIPKFFFGILQAFFKLYSEMPDVVFSKGGPGALPVIIAAKWYMIPVVIHESDAVPGLTTRLSAKFAKRILVAFENAVQYFPAEKVRVVGNPIRKDLAGNYGDAAVLKKQMQLDEHLQNVLVLGGSQGSMRINSFVLDSLKYFLSEMQIVHQTGAANFDEIQLLSKSILKGIGEPASTRYHAFAYFPLARMKEALGAADIIISRAGSGAIFEIAASGKPAILIPLSDAANDHQRENAYAYAKTGAATVVEESNLTANLMLSLIHSMLKDETTIMKTQTAAKSFFKPLAARDIAEEILRLA